jgi:hypothetical protein
LTLMWAHRAETSVRTASTGMSARCAGPPCNQAATIAGDRHAGTSHRNGPRTNPSQARHRAGADAFKSLAGTDIGHYCGAAALMLVMMLTFEPASAGSMLTVTDRLPSSRVDISNLVSEGPPCVSAIDWPLGHFLVM